MVPLCRNGRQPSHELNQISLSRRLVMRCLLVTLTLGLGAIGIVATTPGSAKAFPPTNTTGSRSNNGSGNVNVFGLPTVRVQSNGFGTTETIYSPGGYRTVFTPNGVTRL